MASNSVFRPDPVGCRHLGPGLGRSFLAKTIPISYWRTATILSWLEFHSGPVLVAAHHLGVARPLSSGIVVLHVITVAHRHESFRVLRVVCTPKMCPITCCIEAKNTLPFGSFPPKAKRQFDSRVMPLSILERIWVHRSIIPEGGGSN